ncbi:phosphoglycolate phosphatase [Roseomonas sp. AR75]|uniref:phosphoglycolate phosphatase n=1 Tax=Roseomonas sp. AR75 TaxID=2562311 RepID=UPI0010BF7E85|nr:phosphoglycolate phosphatase [Roseomonas sp. AR75]
MTRLAVFDLDGTLVDSAPDIHAALDRLMAARGLPGFTRAEVTAMIGDGVRALVTRALAARGQPFEEAALDAFMADYEANAAVETRLFPGVAEALQALTADGWRIAICTNKPAAAARELLDALGLLDRVAALGAGDSFPVRKPDPGHLHATIAAAGGAQRGAVMIGDHRNDVAAARGAGIPVVFVGWGYGPLAMAEGAPVVARPEALPGELRAALDGFRA